MTQSTTNLKVPFNEKDQVKSLGARWNAESKHWYVPVGINVAPFEKWLTNSPVASSTQSASKPVIKSSTESNASFDDDLDAINAKLRDAYEARDVDAF